MLSEGADAPPFRLPGTGGDGDDHRQYSLADALDDGPVLLNFYLFDFHPQCTDHVCSLHDAAWFELEDRLTVFGISTDRTFSHSAFAQREGLRFPLLSDSDGDVAERYDVLYEEYVLLQYARAVATGEVTDQIHRALCGAYEPGWVVAVGLIVDFYVGLCNYVAAVELPFEGGEFCGWTPDDETIDALFG